MRLIFIFVIVAFSAFSGLAQVDTNPTPVPATNYAVQFYGVNTNGYPYYWPKANMNVVDSAPDGWVFFSKLDYDTLIATNRSAMTLAKSNRQWQATQVITANSARLLLLYDGIQDARTQLRNFANATNSLTVSQLTVATREIANYEEKLMEFIQRLGPVLKAIYKAEEDPVE